MGGPTSLSKNTFIRWGSDSQILANEDVHFGLEILKQNGLREVVPPFGFCFLLVND